MHRDVAEPGDAGGLEGDVGVEAAGDGAVDDGLLLLIQQPNQLPLGADPAVDLPVRVVQKPHDGRLFVQGRQEDGEAFDFAMVEILAQARAVAIDCLREIEDVQNLVAVVGGDGWQRFKAEIGG